MKPWCHIAVYIGLLGMMGCQKCPLSPAAVNYIEQQAHDHFEGRSPEKVIETLTTEAVGAIKRHEPVDLRKLHDRAVAVTDKLVDASGQPREELGEAVMRLDKIRNDLHDALWRGVVERVVSVHKVCFGAPTIRENLTEWQAGSYYLGLLPEARSAEEAKKYQQIYTSHEQVKEKITTLAKIRYSQWSVGQMKMFTRALRHSKKGTNNDKAATMDAAVKYLGPIVAGGLSVEASQLYHSIIGDIMPILNREQRVGMVERMETVEKKQPFGDPYEKPEKTK
jgi:hypothetical protein